MFGDPPAKDSATDPAPTTNDLFGDPPATDPAPSADDLFGDPPTAEPAPSADDLFGDPNDTPADNDPFGQPPADPPSADDIFGTPEPDAKKPAPSDESVPSADDLFGTPTSTTRDNSSQDIFGNPPAENQPVSLDDIFGTPEVTAPQAAESQEAVPTAQELFGKPTSRPMAPAKSQGEPEKVEFIDGLFDGAANRTWKDNTGNFEIEGRLLVIFKDHVRLLKANGRTTTVPKRRLSQPDLYFVEAVAAKLPSGDVKYVSTAK